MQTACSISKAEFRPVAQPLHRWILGLFMVAVIAFGWKYPILGFAVPLAMLAGIAGAFSRGRYVCGNLCPRGSFYDTLFTYVGGSRAIPQLFSSQIFRWGVVAVLMSFMVWQITANPTDWQHWGRVFWSMCAITTAVGIPLGIWYRSRSWCSFCPVGTMAAAIGGRNYQLRVAAECKECRTCEKSCPMGFSIASHKNGTLNEADCLKCSSCVKSCPAGALTWP